MYPPSLGSDVKSAAEVKVFNSLQAGLDDGWEVFHSAGVMIRDPVKGAQDDEADFVLCHPEKGIVVLEVKGGGIECQHGAWYRLGRAGSRERISDPITQAQDHKYSLKRAIEAADGWRRRELFLAHAIAFPDIPVHGLVLAPDAPREIIVDRRDLDDVEAAIERVLAYHRGARDTRGAPGQDALGMLRDLLAPSILIE